MSIQTESYLYPLADILRDRVSTGPQNAILNINSVCNLKCEFCWIHSPLLKTKMPKTIMPLSYIEKIVRQLKELGVKAVSLSADGEPALHPQIKKIIDIIKNNGISLRITTNLTFGKNELFSSFAKADILVVNLSAPDAKLYRKFCSPVSEKPFLNLAHNLKMFSTLFRKRGKPNIILNYIITRNNYVYIEKMLDFADSLKLPFIRFRILDTTLETKKLFLTHEEILELHSIINKISRSNYSVKHDLRNLLAFRKKADFNLKRCFIGWLALSIENNGDIVFCCQNPWLKIGNWKRDSLKKAWFSKRAGILRKKLKYDFDSAKPKWKSCLFCCYEKSNREIDKWLEIYKR